MVRRTLSVAVLVATLTSGGCGDVVARAVALGSQDASGPPSRDSGKADTATDARNHDVGDAALPIDASTCTPEVEPNNLPLDADPIQLGITCGAIGSDSDTDWYTFSFT